MATHLLGGSREQIIDSVSNAWIDGGALRTYRHAPNTGPRKSWAAGDATSRAVRLALLTLAGEMGYPSALSTPGWGFSDVLFCGQPIRLARPLGTYVMENILFKISFPAEFHAQTAVEAALALHPAVRNRLGEIAEVVIETQEPGVRIIDKTGPLHNPADRDHCLQYMVAVALIFGRLTADDYEEAVASDPRIDALRAAMTVAENPQFTRDYYDPAQAPHRQCRAGQVQGRERNGQGRAGVPRRASRAAGGGLADADAEVRNRRSPVARGGRLAAALGNCGGSESFGRNHGG